MHDSCYVDKAMHAHYFHLKATCTRWQCWDLMKISFCPEQLTGAFGNIWDILHDSLLKLLTRVCTRQYCTANNSINMHSTWNWACSCMMKTIELQKHLEILTRIGYSYKWNNTVFYLYNLQVLFFLTFHFKYMQFQSNENKR